MIRTLFRAGAIVALAVGPVTAAGDALAQQRQQQPQRAPAQQPQRAPAQQQQRAPAQQQQPQELPPAGTPFVVVDAYKVINEAAAMQGVRAQIERQRSAYQAELQKQENELRSADQELARQRAILSPEAFAQRRRELEKRVSDAQQSVQERRRSLDQSFAEASRRIEQAMLEVVIEILRERSYQLVLNKTQVVVVQSSLEITGEVLRRLNQKLPSVAVAKTQN